MEHLFNELIQHAMSEELESALICLLEMEKQEKGKILRSMDFY